MESGPSFSVFTFSPVALESILIFEHRDRVEEIHILWHANAPSNILDFQCWEDLVVGTSQHIISSLDPGSRPPERSYVETLLLQHAQQERNMLYYKLQTST